MKYFGKIGFFETVETAPDVYDKVITEHEYFGDVLEVYGRSFNQGTEINGTITVDNKISIVGDPYIYSHYFYIEYLVWEGVKWTVSHVSVSHPRLILTLGGLYHDQQPST